MRHPINENKALIRAHRSTIAFELHCYVFSSKPERQNGIQKTSKHSILANLQSGCYKQWISAAAVHFSANAPTTNILKLLTVIETHKLNHISILGEWLLWQSSKNFKTSPQNFLKLSISHLFVTMHFLQHPSLQERHHKILLFTQ